MIIGGIARNQINSPAFVESSVYAQDDITLCVERARPLPRWMNLFLIANDNEIWPIAIFCFFTVSMLTFLLTTFEPYPLDAWRTIFLTIQTLFGVTSYKPKSVFIRLLFFSALLVQLLSVAIYNAYFYSFVTRTNIGKQVSTLDEITNANYPVYIQDATRAHLNGNVMVSVHLSNYLANEIVFSYA